MNLGEQGLVALVMVDPCADLSEQVKGNVNGPCLALDLVGQMPGGVPLTVAVAAPALATAAFADLHQAGG
jgi:hypothetical protein